MARKHALYIHIGSHKTGTTSIQHALANNDEALEANGLKFYYRNFHSGKDALPDLHSWLGFVEERRVVPRGMYVLDLERLTSELASLDSDVILSSENFSFVFEREELYRIAKSLSGVFAPIRIICYIRRQDQHVVSHHREGARLGWDAEHDLWGHSSRALPPYVSAHDLYLNYYHRLSNWADAFGDGNVRIKIYDRKRLLNGDSVADFFEVMGISTFKRIDEKNKALDYLAVKFGHLINGCSFRNKKLLVQVLSHSPEIDRKMLPSKNDARSYYSHFVDSNRALNARFKISELDCVFDEDFSMYPDVATDVWDEEAANRAICHLMGLLDDVYGDVDVDVLRDSAIAMEVRDLHLSYRLMMMAQRFRPNGPIIRKKLDEYAANPALRQFARRR